MTETDIERVLRAYEAFDLSSPLDGDLYADNFVFQPSVTGSETAGQEYVGQVGWRKYQEAASEVWSSLTIEVRDLRSLGTGVVLSQGKLHGVGRASGAPVTTPHFAVFRIQEGQIVETRVYQNLDEALSFAATHSDAKA